MFLFMTNWMIRKIFFQLEVKNSYEDPTVDSFQLNVVT